eukprot:CAMPEP_0180540764 /NCGR_PEP_ID=MMETSP1036_2-20121128/67585_1 /TAXON_ID=632150 /ORGANISM="Azadinium spinosum, Strain 3D9" /LENGTH=109 /DNA_ID=CAMNT_0022555571 /DNA_START=88 /DNA_END=413 /DNA_ORIENTATION=-
MQVELVRESEVEALDLVRHVQVCHLFRMKLAQPLHEAFGIGNALFPCRIAVPDGLHEGLGVNSDHLALTPCREAASACPRQPERSLAHPRAVLGLLVEVLLGVPIQIRA